MAYREGFGVRHILEYAEDGITESGPSLERVLPHDGPLIRSFIPEDFRRDLLVASEAVPVGVMYEHCQVVGDKQALRAHPHEFIVLRHNESTVQLYFVDPEHVIGERSPLYPSVSNLMTAKISTDAPPELAIVRYKTAQMVERYGLESMKLKKQFQIATQLLNEQEGQDVLAEFQKDILFRLQVKHHRDTPWDNASVTAIFSVQNELSRFLEGDCRSNPYLATKLTSQLAINNRFLQFLDNGNLQPVTAAAKKRLGV